MTLRSELLDELEKTMADEAYDGGFGAMPEEQFARYVRRLAEVALETAERVHAPTDGEREALRIAQLDARQAAYRQDQTDWFVDHEHEPEITTNAFFRGWDAAVDGGFRRSEGPEPSDEEVKALEAVRGWTKSSGPGVRVLRVLLSMAERTVNQGDNDYAKR